jgi:hypothetical protein
VGQEERGVDLEGDIDGPISAMIPFVAVISGFILFYGDAWQMLRAFGIG